MSYRLDLIALRTAVAVAAAEWREAADRMEPPLAAFAHRDTVGSERLRLHSLAGRAAGLRMAASYLEDEVLGSFSQDEEGDSGEEARDLQAGTPAAGAGI